MTTPLLEVQGLKVAYGGIQAVKGVSFQVGEGELVSLIGANGTGKTTTLKAVTGVQPVAEGEIRYLGRSIRGQGAWDLVRQGLVMVPEGRGTFTRMTIVENLQMGAFVRSDGEVDADIDKVFAIFPRLKERTDQLAGTLSGGEQQMLAVARALMSRPRLLLMDEPTVGLAPLVVAEIFTIIRQLHAEGVSLFVVEQNAHMALKVAQRFYLMEQGRVSFSGTPGELAGDDVIQRAYLGHKRAA